MNTKQIKLKYYDALILDTGTPIEKCLAIIKFICKPTSTSLPHITVRTYSDQNSKQSEFTRNRQISEIKIDRSGSFNINEDNLPYIVYFNCESPDLELVKYKPMYVTGNLHITLYEGNDRELAEKLIFLLHEKEQYLPFTLHFEPPKLLSAKKQLGKKKSRQDFLSTISSYFKDITNTELDYNSICALSYNERIQLIDGIINLLFSFVDIQNKKSPVIDKNSSKSITVFEKASFIDCCNLNNSNDSITSANFLHITPPEYAMDMAKCALDSFGSDSKAIDFGDPSVGTGSLFLALIHHAEVLNSQKRKNYRFKSAVGIEINRIIAKDAYERCSNIGLSVVCGDAISPDVQTISCRNLIIANPPYDKHVNISNEYKKFACELAEEQTGIEVYKNAGLYVHHLLIMDKWLCKDGVAVWLLPSSFYQTKYGIAVRRYLLEKVQLLKIHLYNVNEVQFDNVFVSTVIVVFKKAIPDESSSIKITKGASITHPEIQIQTNNHELSRNINNWRPIFDFNSKNILEEKRSHQSKTVRIKDLFVIKRGIATGANSFFVMTRSEAKNIGIPSIALKPILPKARYLKTDIITASEDGYPNVDPQLVVIDCDLEENILESEYPQFYTYLKNAKITDSNSKPVVERTLVRQRNPWYKQEVRKPPLFVLTYMGRAKQDKPPLKFYLNKSQAIALNTYLLIYPKCWLEDLINRDSSICESLLESLNKSAIFTIEKSTRLYAGGLHKLEPNSLRKMELFDLPKEVFDSLQSHDIRTLHL